MTAPAETAAAELARLEKILGVEARNGYRDRTVVRGGLAAYARHLAERLAAGEASIEQRTCAERLVALFADYHEQSSDARAETIARALALLGGSAAAGPPPAHRLSTAPGSRQEATGRQPVVGRQQGSAPDSRRGASVAQPTLAAAPSPQPPRARRAPDPSLPAPDRPLAEVSGVGPSRERLLARLGLRTVGDLLTHFPLRHLDYPPPARAVDLFFLQRASFEGAVRRVETYRTSRGLQRITATLADPTGEVEAVWFRAGYALRLTPGQRIAISGDLVPNGRRPRFENPDWEPADQPPLHTRGLVPVYPLTKGVAQTWLRELVARAVDRWAESVPDFLPDWLRAEEKLPARGTALRTLHHPPDPAAAAAARRRLAFDELFALQVAVLLRRQAARQAAGRALPIPRAVLDSFLGGLPFTLTAAQQRVLEEIYADLAQPRPMVRLLQGEVGSGKTVVAAAAMLVGVAAGGQAALMAPTEILAEQHYRTVSAAYARAADRFQATLGRVPAVALLTGRMGARERRAIREQVAAGAVDVLIGTQALIQDGVEFRDLLLAVADEQHRFGVRQRLALRAKGEQPHLLVMTATPIPRTLALTLYGDLDLSRLDALPPGRQPIRTVLLRPGERPHAYRRLREEVGKGRQGYVICPLVEDSPHLEARAATEEYERLQRHDLAGLRLGLLHGRLRGEEKEAVMAAFRDGAIDVLVATAVVEVGVDVPNATMMIVEGAERFGLAQLHQFRGRVGRGEHPATCVLIAEAAAPETVERLQTVVDSTDGLALAEADLRLRGPGDFYGLRQSGLPELQVATLSDADLVERTRRAAARLLARDPTLAEHAALAAVVQARGERLGEPN